MMKKWAILMLFVSSPFFSLSSYAGVAHYGKTVGNIQVDSTSGCLYFTLNDVAEADPIKPSSEWFTVGPNSVGHQQTLSILMLAYASGATVKATTTGSLACGYAELDVLRLERKN